MNRFLASLVGVFLSIGLFSGLSAEAFAGDEIQSALQDAVTVTPFSEFGRVNRVFERRCLDVAQALRHGKLNQVYSDLSADLDVDAQAIETFRKVPGPRGYGFREASFRSCELTFFVKSVDFRLVKVAYEKRAGRGADQLCLSDRLGLDLQSNVIFSEVRESLNGACFVETLEVTRD